MIKQKLPEGWKEVTLADVAEVFNGKTPSELEKRKEGHPVLKIKDVSEDGHFKGSFDSFVDSNFYNRYNNKLIKEGDTLILNAAHNAEYVGSKIFYVEDFPVGVISTGEWLIIRAKQSSMDMKFKHFLMTSPLIRNKIQDKVKGIHLYPKDVRDITVILPPITIQQNIVSILEKAEKAKKLRKEVDELTKEFLKSVFMEMFGDVKRIQQVELSQVTEIIMGQSPPGDSYNERKIGTPFFQGKAEFTNRYPIVVKWTTKPSKMAKPNSVLMSVRAPVGSVNICNINCCIGRGLASIYPKEKLTLEFLFSTLQAMEEKIADLGTGSTFKAITSEQLKTLKIPLPPLPIQQKFASIVKEIEQTKEQQKQSKEQIDNLFNVLMQKAFKGELV